MHVYGMMMVMVMTICRVVRMDMYVFFVYVDGYEYSYIGYDCTYGYIWVVCGNAREIYELCGVE